MRQFSFGLGPVQISLQIGMGKGGGNEFEPAGPTWQDAVRASAGYASAGIFEKAIGAARQVRDGKAAFERDTVLFQQPEYSHQMLAWMLLARLRIGKLSVLDFGGGFGSRYFQHKSLFRELGHVRWAVVEQDNIVDAGQAEFNTDELRFFRTIEQAEQGVSPNFLLVSSSLQYMEKPYEMLEALLAKRYPYFLLDRTMARPGLRDELYIQHVSPAIYRASYPVWFLDAQRIEELVQSYGYRLVERIDPYPGSTFGSPQKGWPYMSWYFEQVE
jgi:putative methyltransferase (TIGR04325 family)